MFVVELRVADNYVRIPFLRPNNVLLTYFLYTLSLLTVSYYPFIIFLLSLLLILPHFDVVGNVCCVIDGGCYGR
jgi:hypothetical protein